jgi:hypothetical protein
MCVLRREAVWMKVVVLWNAASSLCWVWAVERLWRESGMLGKIMVKLYSWLAGTLFCAYVQIVSIPLHVYCSVYHAQDL